MVTVLFYFLGNRSRPATQSGNNSAIKESADSNSATIDDVNDVERIDRLSKIFIFHILRVFTDPSADKKIFPDATTDSSVTILVTQSTKIEDISKLRKYRI